MTIFQSTLPRRERRDGSSRLPDDRYFNPRSREGSDSLVIDFLHNCTISIHAPAKGATVLNGMGKQKSGDFNPRSREGSDSPRRIGPNAARNFNPRSREGSDACKCFKYIGYTLISIHAPAKGATIASYTGYLPEEQFQSTLPRRERRILTSPSCP